MYRFECSELFNIDLTKPKGFKIINGWDLIRINEKKNIGWFYRMTLESKAKDCLILFPHFFTYKDHNLMIRDMVYDEVKAILDLNPDDETTELDSTKYIKMITKDNMDNYFNADTVFIYKVPLVKPYKEMYNQCIGIHIIKTGYPSAMMKILLTEKGKQKEEEYMQSLFNSIHYGNIAPEWNEETVNKTVRKMKRKYIFNIKRYFNIGYAGFYIGHRK